MFKFNFNCDADGESISPQPEKSGLDDKIHAESAKLEESVKESNVVSKYDECKEITPTDQQLDTDYSCPPFELNALTLKNGEKINYVSIGDIISELIENADEITCAENSHSDLVAGIYEGGAKIWECTETLADFLTQHKESFQQARVLDLGCGSGILGILALQYDATVHFQDYNESVLQNITIPNVIANASDPSTITRNCKFFSGDWNNYVTKTIDDEKFDIILTSETIYNVDNYSKIIRVLKERLKTGGECYLAAKQHYFGVGGSVGQFKIALSKSGVFDTETVFTCNENVSREILKITLVKATHNA